MHLLLWLLMPTGRAEGPRPGDYALEVRLTTATKAPVVGWVQALTQSTSLVRLTSETDEAAPRWTAQQTTCDVVIDGGAPAHTVVPPAFVASLPVQRYDLVHAVDGAQAAQFQADPGASWVGQGPDGTPVDHEGDGHPGATVWVNVPVFGKVEVYVAQHAHTRLHGAWTGDAAVGRVEVVTMQQRTLGATNKLLASDRPTRVVGEGSFVLLPLSESSCAAARQAVTSHHDERSL